MLNLSVTFYLNYQILYYPQILLKFHKDKSEFRTSFFLLWRYQESILLLLLIPWIQWSVLVTPIWSSRKLRVNIRCAVMQDGACQVNRWQIRIYPRWVATINSLQGIGLVATWPRQSSHSGWVYTVWLSSGFQAWFFSLQLCSSSRCECHQE